MIIKYDDLKKLVSNLDYKLNGWRGSQDVQIEISVVEENPGVGRIMGCLTIKGTSLSQDGVNDAGTTYIGEIYEASENQPPTLVSMKTEKLI